MTGRDLISASFRLLGIIASGETPSASEANDALTSLNQMIDSWSTQSLLIPNKVREVFALVASQQSYTMGSGGNFSTTRPQMIENASLQIPNGTSTLELPMHILNKDQYAGILMKQLQSTYPMYLYPEGTYPLETLNLWPVPTAANNIVLYSWKPLTTIATLDTAISLQPGYERALKFNLAVDLAPEYGRPLSEQVSLQAVTSKAEIKRMNSKPKYLEVDDALRAKPALFNWRTGEPQ